MMRLFRIAAAAACALSLACSADAQILGSGHVLGNGIGSPAAPTDTPLLNVFLQSGSGMSRAGNTTVFATVNGSIANGHCRSTDASGNDVDAGAACMSNDQTANNTFYPSDTPPAVIDRLNDRVFVGGATASDGGTGSGTNDWLTTLQKAISGGAIQYDTFVQMNVLNNNSVFAQGGILGAAQSKNFTSAAGNALGVIGFGVANNTSEDSVGFGGYFEGDRISPASTGEGAIAYGAEFEAFNNVGEVYYDPYSANNDNVSIPGHFGCGAGFTSLGSGYASYKCSAMMDVVANPTASQAGVVFENGSIVPDTLGAYSSAPAFEFPYSYGLYWYKGAVDIGAVITSDSSGNINEEASGFQWNTLQQAGALATTTPTLSCVSGTLGSATATMSYQFVYDHRIFITAAVTISNVGTCASQIYMTTPGTVAGGDAMAAIDNSSPASHVVAISDATHGIIIAPDTISAHTYRITGEITR